MITEASQIRPLSKGFTSYPTLI